MTREKDKVLEMAKDIINLELQLLLQNIGSGNCPFAMYPLSIEGINLKIDCNKISCRDCKNIWAKVKRKEIAKEVIARYDLQESEDNE